MPTDTDKDGQATRHIILYYRVILTATEADLNLYKFICDYAQYPSCINTFGAVGESICISYIILLTPSDETFATIADWAI